MLKHLVSWSNWSMHINLQNIALQGVLKRDLAIIIPPSHRSRVTFSDLHRIKGTWQGLRNWSKYRVTSAKPQNDNVIDISILLYLYKCVYSMVSHFTGLKSYWKRYGTRIWWCWKLENFKFTESHTMCRYSVWKVKCVNRVLWKCLHLVLMLNQNHRSKRIWSLNVFSSNSVRCSWKIV